MTGQDADAKVLFRVVNDEGGADVETLWACAQGNDMYRLANSPFFAYSVSWEDTVYAPFDEGEQFPVFERVVEKSGNRTVRVIFDPPVEEGNESERVLDGLVERGCSYEGASPSYVAVNIPPDVDLASITAYLVACDAEWEHADPSFVDLFLDDG